MDVYKFTVSDFVIPDTCPPHTDTLSLSLFAYVDGDVVRSHAYNDLGDFDNGDYTPGDYVPDPEGTSLPQNHAVTPTKEQLMASSRHAYRRIATTAMTKHSAIALAGLALALALVSVSPAAALADASVTNHPVHGKISDRMTVNIYTGAFTGHAEGIVSSLGTITLDDQGTATFDQHGNTVTITGNGSVTIVAANGDRLIGTMKGSAEELLPSGATTSVVDITITGGTGIFKHASGTLHIACQGTTSAPSNGNVIIAADDCTMAGSIRY